MKTTKLASVSTAVALLAALAGPAVAASPDPGQSVGQNSTVSGTTSGTNQSTIDGSSMSGVNGNAAMNSSTGDGTQQANELYLQRSSGSTQTSSQTSKQSVGVSFLTQSGLTNTSTIGGSAGSGNQGNTAFNSAAGDGHEQANLLNLSALNGSGATSNATQTLNQTFSQQQVVSNGATNTSTIGNQGGSNPSAPGPGEKANGIVTFNSASGAENVQAN